MKVKLFIIGAVIFVVFIVAGIFFVLKNKEKTEPVSTKTSSEVATRTEDFVHTGDIKNVKWDDDNKSDVQVKIGRVLKLVPETGKTNIDVRSCRGQECYPMHAVNVASDEALILLDLEFTANASTAIRFDGYNYASFHLNAGNTKEVWSLKFVDGQWLEEKPVFALEASAMPYKLTVWTRVPADTSTSRFVYAKNSTEPIIDVSMQFDQAGAPSLSEANKKLMPSASSGVQSEGCDDICYADKLLACASFDNTESHTARGLTLNVKRKIWGTESECLTDSELQISANGRTGKVHTTCRLNLQRLKSGVGTLDKGSIVESVTGQGQIEILSAYVLGKSSKSDTDARIKFFNDINSKEKEGSTLLCERTLSI